MLTLQHIKHRLPSEYVFLPNENKNNKNKQRKNNMMKVCFLQFHLIFRPVLYNTG
jgi:hypothetical protein